MWSQSKSVPNPLLLLSFLVQNNFVDCRCVFENDDYDAAMMGSGSGAMVMFGNGTGDSGLCNQGCNFVALFVVCILLLSFLVFIAHIAIVTIKLRYMYACFFTLQTWLCGYHTIFDPLAWSHQTLSGMTGGSDMV